MRSKNRQASCRLTVRESIATALIVLLVSQQVQSVHSAERSKKSPKPEKNQKQVLDQAPENAGLSARREDLPDDSLVPISTTHASSDDSLLAVPATFKNALMIVGPSASGKTTLAKRLVEDLGEQVHMLARHTSRQPRHNEVNGTDYIFVSRQDILAKLKQGEFVTVSELADNIYGISKEALRTCIAASAREGKLCMTEMMVSSMVLDALHMIPELNGVFVFIRTPNITVMEQRLRGRKTENDEAVASRVHQAKADMTFCDDKRHLVNYCLTNTDLEYTYRRLKSIVRLEFPFLTFPGETNCSASWADTAVRDDDTVTVVRDAQSASSSSEKDKRLKK